MNDKLKSMQLLIPIPTCNRYSPDVIKNDLEGFNVSLDCAVQGVFSDLGNPNPQSLNDLLEEAFSWRQPTQLPPAELDDVEMDKLHHEYQMVVDKVNSLLDTAKQDYEDVIADMGQFEIVAVESFKRRSDYYQCVVTYREQENDSSDKPVRSR